MKRLWTCLVFFTVLGCAKAKDADKIGDAQACLDKLGTTAASTEVDECVAKVDGIDSSGAQNIRCAAAFIKEGFASGKKFIDAFASIDGGTSAANNKTLMGILTFTSAGNLATDAADTLNTFNTCYESTGKGSTLLASYSAITMSMMTFFNAKNSGGCSSTPVTVSGGYKIYDLASCLGDAGSIAPAVLLVDSSSVDAAAIAAQTAMGTAIIKTFNLACSGTGANKDLCDLYLNATSVGTANARAVAVQFLHHALGLP